MFDAEDAEFNDIIDEQGVLVGEELLVNEFAADEGEAKAQMQTILAVMEKDQKHYAIEPEVGHLWFVP